MPSTGDKPPFIDRNYARELDQLRERLLLMAGRVEDIIVEATASLVHLDAERARRTVLSDRRINQDEVDLDRLCLELLSLRKPMAIDLRMVTLTLKMVTDLERIADLAVNICERAVDLSASPRLVLVDEIPQMAALVQTMTRDAIDAFVAQDEEKAHLVIATDDQVDELYQDAFRCYLDLMIADVSKVESAIHYQSVAKVLERMADHTTNLAEQVVFMVRGTDIRHSGKLDLAEAGGPVR